ncbi:MAG: hypothetical protein RIQ81_345 [Pseudomonadota bacterium]
MSSKSSLMIMIAICFLSRPSFAEVVTTDVATQCATGMRDDRSCQENRIHPWAGTLELSFGLDGALAGRTSDERTFSTKVKPNDSANTTFKNDGSESLRFAATFRLDIFEKFGAGFTAGYDATSLDATPKTQTGYVSSDSSPFSMDYSGPFVETAIFFPVQRLNTVGILGGLRRYFVDHATATNEDFAGKSKLEYSAKVAPREAFFGLFVGPFYVTASKRTEVWSQDADQSLLDNSGTGFEIGLSGPFVMIFPR